MTSGVFSVVSRLGGSLGSLVSSVSTRSCRFASRDAKGWRRQSFAEGVSVRRPHQQHHSMYDDDGTMDDVEDKLDDLLREQKKKQTAVKLSKTKRLMLPPGAPERTLSWDTIEQIRYLRRERPEEWSVARLAEGFAVPPADILRVLKSKFTPNARRKDKQDSSVMARMGQQTAALPAGGAPPGQLLLPAQETAVMLEAGDGAGGPRALQVPSANRTPPARVEAGREISAMLPGGGRASVAVRPNSLSLTTAAEIRRLGPASEEHLRSSPAVEGDEEEEEERWDGEVLTESELEQLMLTTKPSPAVQVGKDFFDTEGRFLYRI